MPEPSVSALERFLQAHGDEFTSARAPGSDLGRKHLLGELTMMAAIVGGAVLIHLMMANPGVNFGPALVALFFAIVFSAGAVSGYRRRKTDKYQPRKLGKHKTPSGATVSPEAQSLISALMVRYVWSWDPRYVPIVAAGFAGHPMQSVIREHARLMEFELARSNRMLSYIPNAALRLLEEAASEYNRTAGFVESAGANESLKRLGPSILRGADEAMAGIFHQVEQISEFPETESTLVPAVSDSVDKLRQLADRVETVRTQQAHAPAEALQLANLDGVLEDLRLEQLAMSELSTREDDGLRGHLQT